MAVIVDGTEIVLSGTVGGYADDYYWNDGFGASDVIGALAQIGRDKDVTIRLNSGGGIATEGAAIHAAIAAHKGEVTIVVEGIAASAASLLLMAGDTIVMSPGATLMIHDPAGYTVGTADEHEKSLRALNALATAYAEVYADRSGKSVAEARAIMRDETWYSPAQAVAAGFATRVGDASADDASEPEPAAFAYGVYAKAPARFTALANARGWKPRALMAAPVASTPSKGPTMKTTANADTVTGTDPVAPPVADPAATPADPVATPADPAATSVDPVANGAEIGAILAAAGVTVAVITAFVKNGGTVATAKARASEIGTIRAMVTDAGKLSATITASVADELIASGASAEKARATLFSKLVAAQSGEVSAHVTADGKAVQAKPAATIDHAAVYARMNNPGKR